MLPKTLTGSEGSQREPQHSRSRTPPRTLPIKTSSEITRGSKQTFHSSRGKYLITDSRTQRFNGDKGSSLPSPQLSMQTPRPELFPALLSPCYQGPRDADFGAPGKEIGTVRRGCKDRNGRRKGLISQLWQHLYSHKHCGWALANTAGTNATPSLRFSRPRALQRNLSVCRRCGTAHGASLGALGAAPSRSSAPVCLPLLCSPLPPLSLRSKPGRAAPQHHGTGQLRAELPQPSHLRTPGEAALPSPQKAEKNPLKAGRSVLPPMPLYRSRAAPFDGTATLPRPPPNFSLRSG